MLARLALGMLLLVTQGAGAPQDLRAAKAAFVKEGQIFVSLDGVTSIQLTRDRAAKSLPLWSKDGSKIAFLASVERKVALTELRIIAADGEPLSSILVRPTGKGAPAGMQTVEGLEWLSNSRIAISGSINPSTVESIVIDVEARTEVNDIYDDDGAAAFSSNGTHVAYITGSPHFTPATERRPQLNVDNKKVYPSGGNHVEFVSAPSWSADGKFLAIISQLYGADAGQLIVWQPDGGIRSYPLASPVQGKLSLYWVDSTLSIDAAQWALAWSPRDELIRPTVMTQQNDPLKSAKALNRQLQSGVARFGGTEADIWCADCLLRNLPRSRGPWSVLEN